jgi:hypothetical protein
MKHKKIALGLIILACLAFMTGCSTISLETQYGSFTYELPEPKGTKK